MSVVPMPDPSSLRFARGLARVWLLAALTIPLSSASALERSAGSESPAAPKLKLAATEADWGTLIQGDIWKHEIVVENTGDAPLELSAVSPSCGCATASFDKSIAPGAKGRVEVVVDSSNLAGTQFKWVDIKSNDPDGATARFFLKGDVTPLFRGEPPALRLSGFPGKPLEQTVVLTAATELGGEILSIEPESEETHAKLELEEVEKHKTYRLRLTAPASNTAWTRTEQHRVKVKTKDGKTRTTRFTIVVDHARRWRTIPSYVTFSKSQTKALKKDGAEPLVGTFEVRPMDPGLDLEVTGLDLGEVPDGVFELSRAPAPDGKSIIVTVKLLRAVDAKSVQTKLEVRTNDSSHPTSEVRVNAYF